MYIRGPRALHRNLAAEEGVFLGSGGTSSAEDRTVQVRTNNLDCPVARRAAPLCTTCGGWGQTPEPGDRLTGIRGAWGGSGIMYIGLCCFSHLPAPSECTSLPSWKEQIMLWYL